MLLSVSLGVIIVILIGFAAVLWIVARLPGGESACTHDCDQGRHCTCGKKNDIQQK